MMKGLSRIQVEPLSDQRWERIERSLISRLELEAPRAATIVPRRIARGRFWLVAAALAGALGTAVFHARETSEPQAVEQPSRITTGATASHLALPGLSLDVEPQSAVIVGAETPQGLLIVVDRGSIACRVAPRAADAPLVVQAGAARVRVLGTRFSVTRVGESAHVEVQDGVVEVSYGGRSTRVHRGGRWSAEEPRHAPTAVPPAPSAAPVAPDESPQPDAARSGRPASATPRGPSERERTAARESSSAEPASESPARSAQLVFEQATALERSDPARASELYRSLEAGGGSWAQNALYARGRLEASRGNRVEARRLLERYLELYPRGSNAEDARAVLRRFK